jgi:hypothetical protein
MQLPNINALLVTDYIRYKAICYEMNKTPLSTEEYRRVFPFVLHNYNAGDNPCFFGTFDEFMPIAEKIVCEKRAERLISLLKTLD